MANRISLSKKEKKDIVKFSVIFGTGIFLVFTLLIPSIGLFETISLVICQISGHVLILYLLSVVSFYSFSTGLFKRYAGMWSRFKYSWFLKNLRVIGLSAGVIISSILALPLLTTPISISNIEEQFNQYYGINWRTDISSDVRNRFLPSQFNLFTYFLGFPQRACNIEFDNTYFQNEEIILKYDVYYPKNSNRKLPGNNSVIIKLHGGGWILGDKGIGNRPLVNKYLASLGYIVFDIQYGLLETDLISLIPTPDYVRGNFTFHDMISHIGIFTKQLSNIYAERYNANLNSVFISGDSAGGHLASVVGLGYNDAYFAGNFSNDITIKGIFPLYPPNFAEYFATFPTLNRLIPGSLETNPLTFEKFTPSNLIDETDPPAFIFQGLQDGLVPPINSQTIKEEMDKLGTKCILLSFPFASHASDTFTSSNFAQTWLYYLERFLYFEQ